MRRAIRITLAMVVVGLSYMVAGQILTPLRFRSELGSRRQEVVERLKDIRSAERAFRQLHRRYTSCFDSLIGFLLTDSLVFERSAGSTDGPTAAAVGKESFKVAAIDTVFAPRRLTEQQIRQLAVIPFSDGKQFYLEAGMLTTGSGVVVPVFECRAPFKDFLADLDKQELINLTGKHNALGKYAGVMVGSMKQATNDAGNWE